MVILIFLQKKLCEHGYKPTYYDVTKSIKHQKYIHDMHKYDIKFDENVGSLSLKYDFFEYDKLSNSIYNKSSLYHVCEFKSLSDLIRLVEYGLKPDENCLKIACKRHDNFDIIKYLIVECKINPNVECVKEFAKHIRNNKTLMLLLESVE